MASNPRTSQLQVEIGSLLQRLATAFADGHDVRRAALTEDEVAPLVAAGRITFQVGPTNRGFVVQMANLSSFDNGEGDLRHVLRAYLADPDVSAQHKKDARVVVRFVTGAPTQCADETLAVHASKIPAAQLHTLLGKIDERATGTTRRNYKSTLRKLLRYAAERGVVPIIFPPTQVKDAWYEIVSDEARPVRGNARWAILFARDMFVEHLGSDAADPRVLTPEQVDTVLRHLRKSGRFYEAHRVRDGIGRLGSLGIGPAREPASLPYITWPEKENMSGPPLGTPEGLIALLRAHQYPESLIEAIQYHTDAILLTDKELGTKTDHPAGRLRKRVAVSTFVAISLYVRLLLWSVRHRVKLAPAKTTPETLFSEATLRAAIAHLETEWDERAKRGELTAPVTNQLMLTVSYAGTVADTLRGRAKHRRLQLQDDETHVDREVVEHEARLEARYTKGAEHAYARAESLQEVISDSPVGGKGNTRKDIREIYEQTPPAYWLKTLHAMLAETEKIKRANRADLDSLMHVQFTLALALLISTGMRWSELCHVRLDVQFSPEHRRKQQIVLRKTDRKNKKVHTVHVSPDIVPVWLLAFYLDVVRPKLLKKKAHEWLIVQPSGDPVGCPEEKADGTGRDIRIFNGRKGRHHILWQERVGPWAFNANGHCPEEEGRLTPHCIRNAFAAYLVIRFGISRAAHYLGDSESSVDDTYGFLTGKAAGIDEVAADLLAEITAAA